MPFFRLGIDAPIKTTPEQRIPNACPLRMTPEVFEVGHEEAAEHLQAARTTAEPLARCQPSAGAGRGFGAFRSHDAFLYARRRRGDKAWALRISKPATIKPAVPLHRLGKAMVSYAPPTSG